MWTEPPEKKTRRFESGNTPAITQPDSDVIGTINAGSQAPDLGMSDTTAINTEYRIGVKDMVRPTHERDWGHGKCMNTDLFKDGSLRRPP